MDFPSGKKCLNCGHYHFWRHACSQDSCGCKAFLDRHQDKGKGLRLPPANPVPAPETLVMLCRAPGCQKNIIWGLTGTGKIPLDWPPERMFRPVARRGGGIVVQSIEVYRSHSLSCAGNEQTGRAGYLEQETRNEKEQK